MFPKLAIHILVEVDWAQLSVVLLRGRRVQLGVLNHGERNGNLLGERGLPGGDDEVNPPQPPP